MSYILLTPVKDEERNLPDLISSMANQTVLPGLWVIVNDGSKDRTPKIIDDARGKFNWIQKISLEGEDRDFGPHFTNLLRDSFDFCIDYCRKKGIIFDYLGLIDGDMVLTPTYFEELIKHFEEDSKLGIASGGLYYRTDDGYILEKARRDIPIGGARLYRRECFEEIGGFSTGYPVDSVTESRAILKGWKLRLFKQIKVVQKRKTSSAEGFWKGYKLRGQHSYYLNYNPLIVIANGIKFSLERPYYRGLAYIYGYLFGLMRRCQINDKELKKYFFYYKLFEILKYYIRWELKGGR